MVALRLRGALALAGMVALGVIAPATAGAVDDASAAPVPGLYGTDEVAIVGSGGWATVTSALSCADVKEVLAAGDWSVLDSFTLPQATAAGVEDTFLLLGRGPARAAARLRGADGTCNGWVGVLTERPFVAKGATELASTARMLPTTCVRLADGQVSVDGFHDVTGGWLGRIALTFVPVEGVRDVSLDSLSMAGPSLQRIEGPMFSALGAARPPQLRELVPGPRFSGSMDITSLDPLAAHVTLNGLVDQRGRRQDLDAWLDCRIREGAKPRDPTAPVVAGAVTIRLAVDDRTRMAGGYSSRQSVVIDARLEQVVPGRWEGAAEAVGEGTYKEPDLSDLKGSCAGRWTGTQPVDLVGTESGEVLRLTVSAGGPAEVDYAKRCNPDSHTAELSFPWGVAVGSTLELTWPPGTPNADDQKVANRVPGLGSQAWNISLTAAE